MKKFYVTLLSLAVVGSASAQVTNTTNVGKTLLSPVHKSKAQVEATTDVQKATLWGPNTFGTPSDWTFNDNAGSGDNWVIGTGVPSGPFAIPGIASTTANDGFALFDSDALCSGNQNADVIIAQPVDLTGNPSVAVQFESYYRAYQGACYVIASADGVNWTEIPVHSNIALNSSTANPVTVQANVSAVVGDSATAWIGFRYIGGCDYAWMVDDVCITTLPDNDMALVRGWHADIITDYEYSMTPLTQAREMIAGVVVENQGGQAQTVDVTCDVTDGTNVLTTSTQSVTLIPAEMDTLWFSTGFTPSANGNYRAEFSIPADMVTTNDEFITSELEVNDNLMAHDYGANTALGWDPGANDPTNAQAPHSWGNVYYPEVNQEIRGVDINFASGTTAGLYVLVRVQEMDPSGSIQDPLTFNNEIDHVIDASEIGSAITTIVFPNPSILEAGKGYMIDVFKVDGTSGNETFNIGASEGNDEDADFGAFGYGPYGVNDAVNYYLGWDASPIVRANFDPTLAVETNTLEGVSVYPNPSTGVITVSNDNGFANSIRISNTAGQIVYTQEVSSEVTVDLSTFGAGMYVVTVEGDNGSLVEKVVIK
ncbi:MAG: T9SS type A sorting domain-containing protein [bacterium]|nr:T9SS type A sorting domain-containing protein [bacterium]